MADTPEQKARAVCANRWWDPGDKRWKHPDFMACAHCEVIATVIRTEHTLQGRLSDLIAEVEEMGPRSGGDIATGPVLEHLFVVRDGDQQKGLD